MTEVHMTAGVTTGDQFTTVQYPDDTILLRVTDGGNVQVIEYISSDREGPPAHSHQWHEIEFVIEGEVEFYVDGVWTRGGPGRGRLARGGAAPPVRVPAGPPRLLYVTIGPPYDAMARELAALYAGGTADASGIVAIAYRHGLRLEGDSA